MNKKLIGLSLLAVANGAFAQTSDTSIIMYGTIDIGIGYSQHSLSEDPNYQQGMSAVATKYGVLADTGMFNGGLSASRIGFRGTEDMGGGLKAIFNLETGFNSQDGVISNGPVSLTNNASKTPTTVTNDSSLAGQLFNRTANVGLSSADWGTVTFGRNYSLGNDSIMAYDPMDGSGTFSLLGYSASYAGGGFTEDFRIDNSVKYTYKPGNGMNFGLLYKFGGQAGSTNAGQAWQLGVGYVEGPFGIQATYENNKDAISLASGAAVGGPLVPTYADTRSYMIAASYTMDKWRFRGGYELIDFDNPSNPTNDLALTSVEGYAVLPSTAAVGGAVTTYGVQKEYELYFAGATYAVSPVFSTTVAYYGLNQNNYSSGTTTACTTGSNTAACSGNSKYYSILGDYKLSKRTDLYAGYMLNHVQGGFSSGFLTATSGSASNGFFGMGMRHMF